MKPSFALCKFCSGNRKGAVHLGYLTC